MKAKRICESAKMVLRTIKYNSFCYQQNSRPKLLGDKIVVLGNGISASYYKQNYERFKGYDLLVVNFYPVKEADFWMFKPQYLCLFDPQFFAPKGVYYTEKHKKEKGDIEDLYKAIERIDWKMKIITVAGNTLPITNKNIEYIFLSKSSCSYDINNLEKKFISKNWAIPNAQNVIVGALDFAVIFGYREIALFGVEQNWLQSLVVDENNILNLECEYFYGKVRTVVNASYKDEMLDIVRTFDGFEAIAKIAQERNIRIINYAINSYLQCFEKSIL